VFDLLASSNAVELRGFPIGAFRPVACQFTFHSNLHRHHQKSLLVLPMPSRASPDDAATGMSSIDYGGEFILEEDGSPLPNLESFDETVNSPELNRSAPAAVDGRGLLSPAETFAKLPISPDSTTGSQESVSDSSSTKRSASTKTTLTGGDVPMTDAVEWKMEDLIHSSVLEDNINAEVEFERMFLNSSRSLRSDLDTASSLPPGLVSSDMFSSPDSNRSRMMASAASDLRNNFGGYMPNMMVGEIDGLPKVDGHEGSVRVYISPACKWAGHGFSTHRTR
jgi:hypothetical protein